ncbi:zinc finger protein ztf-16 isoform X2 [Neocloeon triangulifer]|uniref:zinc finger protein ztf-16 isoform X2 n=1 Tax=Neocloeon triangulifer TaxID=2078957 RepID=UPI00286EBE33|nr:zinc finger protein ztf-16 isoform X2 [Neocloeon triangulifer]
MTEPDRHVGADDSGSSAEEAAGGSGTGLEEEHERPSPPGGHGQSTSEDGGGGNNGDNGGPMTNGSGNGGGGGGNKMFECDVCNMKFSNGANMRRHKMRHTGVKPYECRVCQKRFFRKDHLMEHFTTHTKSLPYHCPICNKGFQRQIAMRAHFQNEHVGHNDVVKTCPLCTYRATSMKSLRVHFFNRHGIDLDNPATPPGLTNSALRFEPSDMDRSQDSTSPMQMIPPHFLAPHVEISMAPAGGSNFHNSGGSFSPPADLSHQRPGSTNGTANSPSASPQSSNSNTPSSTAQQAAADLPPPSISLIPIKQEPKEDAGSGGGAATTPERQPSDSNGQPLQESALSLIKVSPLKSLLRDEGAASAPRRGRASALAQCLEQPPRGGMPGGGCCQCVHCGIVFPDQTLYFLHKGCHSDSNPWKCNICGEQCSNIYDFNSHLLSKTHQ